MILQLKISIALCTYNGERFLQEQLDSFLAQTRRPEELVVCDDRSTDRTREILKAFQEIAPFPMRIIINEQRLGFRKNFEKALSLCRGDLISFSDQDDIWLPEKLKEVEGAFLQYPAAGYVFHDALVVDENANPRGFSLWDYYGFRFQNSRYFPPGKFTHYCLNQVILGATITLSAELREYLLPLPDQTAHDTWVSFAGSLVMPVVALPKKLNKYRQHTHQLFGASDSFKDRYSLAKNIGNAGFAQQAKNWRSRLPRLATDSRLKIGHELINQINDLIEHLDVRGSISGPILKRIPIILNEIITRRYHKYSSGWRSVARDLWI
jgi:glycosyltransferase involved in cell wall biosynthesis